MNPKLQEINELIALCDQMLNYVWENGFISTRNETYITYTRLWERFSKKNDVISKQVIKQMFFRGLYLFGAFFLPMSTTLMCAPISSSLSPSGVLLYRKDILELRNTLVQMKHTKFKDDYEKIFISHREKDAKVVSDFIELLYAIGIKRPTVGNPNGYIFCTSCPDSYIPNGEPNTQKIRDMLSTDEHVFYILWYSDEYFNSPACQHEAGAIWAMEKKYQEILMPNFDSSKIKGLLDRQPVWFRANDKMRLNTFKLQIEKMFGLSPITLNAWESARDRFIHNIEIDSQNEENKDSLL